AGPRRQTDRPGGGAPPPPRPGLPAGAPAARPALFGRQPDARHHVVVAGREQDRGGEPVGSPRVEDAPDPGLLVAGVTAPEQTSRQPVAGPRDLLAGRHPTTAAPPATGTWAPPPGD